MLRSMTSFALLLAAGAVIGLGAAESTIPKLQIQYDDWAPGEVGPWISSSQGGDEGDLPPCDYIDQGDSGRCEVTPSTPKDPPAEAPERCFYYDWTYEPEIYLSFGCG